MVDIRFRYIGIWPHDDQTLAARRIRVEHVVAHVQRVIIATGDQRLYEEARVTAAAGFDHAPGHDGHLAAVRHEQLALEQRRADAHRPRRPRVEAKADDDAVTLGMH